MLVAAISLKITYWLTNGQLRRFRLMWQNMPCSILFLFLVTCGTWATDNFSSGSSATGCGSRFQSRLQLLLDPATSAVINTRQADCRKAASLSAQQPVQGALVVSSIQEIPFVRES